MARHASNCLNKRQVVVAVLFSLWNIAHWRWQEDVSTILNNESLTEKFDKEKCSTAIASSIRKNIQWDFLSIEQFERATRVATMVAMDRTLKGDYVEVDTALTSSCNEIGGYSLIVSSAQRTVMSEPFCHHQMTPKRAVWLAIRDEQCVKVVIKLFKEHRFSMVDTNGPLDSNRSVHVPIHLLVGPTLQTLSNSPVEKIAFLRIGHHSPRKISEIAGQDEQPFPIDDQLITNTLHALISFYRKVGMGGFVALIGVWLDEVKEFLSDGNHTVLHVSNMSTFFMKADAQIRIPKNYRQTQIQPAIDSRVLLAWHTLDEWHKETVKRFVGHVGTNPFQTYRYIEAMQHVVDIQEKKSGLNKEAKVNVCETGFNGDKLTATYGNNFHIVWGDSKVTLKDAKHEMGDQRCHLIVVDGDHSKEGVINDLQNFLEVADPGATVFGDDCAPYKGTVPQSEKMLEGWMEFVNKKLLISVANYRNPDLPSPGFVEGIVPDIFVDV